MESAEAEAEQGGRTEDLQPSKQNKQRNREGVKGMEPTKGFDTMVLAVVEDEDEGEEQDWGEQR